MDPLKSIATANKDQPILNLKSLDKKSPEIGKRDDFTEDFSVSTILIVAYLIETIVQIVLIVNCYRSLLYVSATSSPNWLWILFISWILTSLLVTLLSIMWTFRSLDFEDRICGQLLCYLMHLCLLGLVWRYLKIALAYEKADVEEFYKLRKLQIYIQAFPLLAIHFSYLINSTTQNYPDNTVGWLIAGELFSSIISLSLFQVLKLKNNQSFDQPNNYSDHNHKPRLTSGGGVGINLRICKILFLISRVIIVGLLVSLPSYNPMLVIVAHLLTNFMWTCLTTIIFNARAQTNLSSTSNECNAKNKNDVESTQWMNHDHHGLKFYNSEFSASWEKNDVGRHVKNSLVSSYALFWDVTVKMSSSGDGSGLNFLCLSLPVLLVLVENTAVLIFHLRQCQTTIVLVILSGTCFSFGILLFILMTTWNKWKILFHSHEKVLKLPTIEKLNETHSSFEEDGRSEKFTKFLKNSMILEFESCSEVRGDVKKSEGRKMMMTYNENLETENLQSIPNEGEEGGVNTFNQGTSEGTNTYNYDRINESLMMAVKMEEMDFHTLCSIPQNTMSSTSSRNTNTISNLTLQNSPELRKSNAKPIHPINNSPFVIRKAAKIQLKLQKRQPNVILKSQSNPHPTDSHSVPTEISVRSGATRCCALPSEIDNAIYEKLIEDAYGILICEGEESSKFQNQSNSEKVIKQGTLGSGAHATSGATVFNKKLKILCAKCLGNHDPLLSNCCIDIDAKPKFRPTNQVNVYQLNSKITPKKQMLVYVPRPFESPKMCSETTEYPTDTEFTCNLYEEDGDEISNSSQFSALHQVTYVNVPIPQTQNSSPRIVGSGHFHNISSTASATLFPSAEVRKEFTGMEYVKAWLLMNDVTAKNMLNIKTNSLNRGNGNRHNNKVCNKSKHILKSRLHSHSTLANPYRKSQPVLVQLKPPPLQKQHPDFKIWCSTIINNTPISHSHHSVKQRAISKGNTNYCASKMSSTVSCNQFHDAPAALKTFNELQNDLIETVV